jgi:glutathione S-transferase
MKLIGMLDSPYVRRVAISLQRLGIRFEHQSLSVFRSQAQFQQINPVVKAPTLVCDDGVVLMDSPLILQYAEALAHPRSLLPFDLLALRRDLQLTGLALAGCDKSVQIVYEQQRPGEMQYAPWLERIRAQAQAAYRLLEQEFEHHPPPAGAASLSQAGITTAVAWHFTQMMLPGLVTPREHPQLAAWSTYCETLAEFRAAPYGAGTVRIDY